VRKRKKVKDRSLFSSLPEGQGGREGRRSCVPFSAGLAEACPFSYWALGAAGGEVVVAPVVVLTAADAAATEGGCVMDGGRESVRGEAAGGLRERRTKTGTEERRTLTFAQPQALPNVVAHISPVVEGVVFFPYSGAFFIAQLDVAPGREGGREGGKRGEWVTCREEGGARMCTSTRVRVNQIIRLHAFTFLPPSLPPPPFPFSSLP
jgi:hypothetical protein